MFRILDLQNVLPPLNGSDQEFVVLSKLSVKRNLETYEFSDMLNEDRKKEVNSLIEDFVKILPYSSDLYDLSYVLDDDIKLLGLIDREILEEDILKSSNLRPQYVRILFDPKRGYSVATNIFDHVSFSSFSFGNAIENLFNISEDFFILFDDYFVPVFDENLGFITSSYENIGHGVTVKVLLNVTGLRNSGSLEKVLETIRASGIHYSHNPFYEKTDFMELKFIPRADISLVANIKEFVNILNKIKEKEVIEREKFFGKFDRRFLIKDLSDIIQSLKMVNFMHYKAFLNIVSRLFIIYHNDRTIIKNLSQKEFWKLIDMLIVLLRDTSIMLYSNITVPNDSLIGRERASLVKKFLSFLLTE